MRPILRTDLVLPLVLILLSGCGSPPASNPPTASSAPTSTVTPSPSAWLATPTSPSASPTSATDLSIGASARTVSDRLRVRSEPRVADDSLKYEPVLPAGTDLRVIGGPVTASGYTWVRVEVGPGVLARGQTTGWVAIADHDGTPWVARVDAPAEAALAISDVSRAPASPKAARSAGTSVDAFAVDAYKALLRDGSLDLSTANAVFSPTSIALALGMTRAGARGTTGTEMDDVLHVDGWPAVSSGLGSLDQVLRSRNVTWNDGDGPRELALRIANTTFAQQGWTLEPAFLDAIAEAFGAGVNLVDYEADPEAARQTINAWVKRQTAGRIPELLLAGNVTADTRLYLVNAIYLKAEWEEWFAEGATKDRTFTRLDGSTVKVPTMVKFGDVLGPWPPYAHGEGWRATELAYKSPVDQKLVMTIIEPDDLRAFEEALTPAVVERIVRKLDDERATMFDTDCIDGCYAYDLTLYLPKFSIETRAQLAPLLASMGMPTAFDPDRADLTGIHVPTAGEDRPFIKNVIHQANIDVDEKGTEAAAATAVGVDTGGGSMPLKTITFKVDHPFLFLLRDVDTGAILFMGRVVDPSIGR